MLARPQRRNLRRLSPQSTGLSCPLSVWTQCLDTEINYYRDSFGGVPSDLRSSGSVGGPAGAAVMRTGAGGCKVEIYDMFRIHLYETYQVPGVIVPAHWVTCCTTTCACMWAILDDTCHIFPRTFSPLKMKFQPYIPAQINQLYFHVRGVVYFSWHMVIYTRYNHNSVKQSW